jgi:hypothetical protein
MRSRQTHRKEIEDNPKINILKNICIERQDHTKLNPQ